MFLFQGEESSIPKSDQFGVTVTVIHVAGQQFLAVLILEAIGLTVVK